MSDDPENQEPEELTRRIFEALVESIPEALRRSRLSLVSDWKRQLIVALEDAEPLTDEEAQAVAGGVASLKRDGVRLLTHAEVMASEQLTNEERELATRPGRAFPQDAELLAKLLRIHDAQRERIAELERLLSDPREFLCTCGHLRGEPHRPGCPALP